MRYGDLIGGRRVATSLALTAVVVPAAIIIHPGPDAHADAVWSAQATGAGVAASANMPAGHRPVVSIIAGTTRVKVVWAPATFPSGTEVGGYIVTRTSAGQSTQVCQVTASVGTCEDTPSVQTAVTYTVTPRQQLWQGPASPPSVPLVVPAPELDACTLVTSAEAAALAGEAVTQHNPGGGLCSYSSSGHSIAVFVETLATETAAEAALPDVLGAGIPASSMVVVQGVGSKALSYTTSATIEIAVAANSRVAYIALSGSGVSNAMDALVTAAQTAAGRL